ncbi:MAG: hypothetical protein HOO67_07160 [Candidatus Peribacteraceae bacterium]|nr:hypothetical protein [Candidatus Peribacteraceae bacterium]
MPKNAFLPLATLLAIFTLAVHLYPSVAELKAAATVIPDTSTIVATKQIAGPRPHQVRQRPVTTSSRSSSSSTVAEVPSPTPVLVLEIPEKPLLEKILDASGVKDEQRTIVATVLSQLKPACLEKLQTFAILYDNPESRGLAGKGVILVSGNVGDQELAGLLLHEGLGHFRDITCITGLPESGASAFTDGDDAIYNDDPSAYFYRLSWENVKTRRRDAEREDFVTGYAYQGDNFEDLAESVTYYMTQEKKFRARAADNAVLAQKLLWLETYMPKTKDIAESDAEWNEEIAWDATKLPFTWVRND